MNSLQRLIPRIFEPNVFLVTTSLVIAVTAAGKIYSVAFGSIPHSPDPVIFIVSQKALLLLATFMELVVITIALSERFKFETRCGCVLSLAIAFTLYRAGLYKLGIAGCNCVGTVPHNPVLSAVLWAVLGYMTVGSIWIIATRNSKWLAGGAR